MATTSKKTTSKTTTGSKKSSEKENAPSSRSGSNSKAKPAPKSAGGSTKSSSSKSASKSSSSKKATAKASAGSKPKQAAKGTAAGGRASSGGTKKPAGGSTKPKSAGAKSKSSADKGASKASGNTAQSTKSGKASGTAKKGVVSRITEAVGSLLAGGERNVLDLLKEDHQRVDAYFKEVKAAEDANHEKVFKKIKAELDLHAHVEEVIFYPRLMEVGNEDLKKIVREGVEEHGQVKTLLAELSELKGTDKVFKAKLKVLIENVEHHVEEEENEMFPLVEDQLGEETLVKLADRIEKEKGKAGQIKPKSRVAKGGKKS